MYLVAVSCALARVEELGGQRLSPVLNAKDLCCEQMNADGSITKLTDEDKAPLTLVGVETKDGKPPLTVIYWFREYVYGINCECAGPRNLRAPLHVRSQPVKPSRILSSLADSQDFGRSTFTSSLAHQKHGV